MIFNDGVRITGLQTEILLAMWIADDIHREQLGTQAFVTSVRDGGHSRNSKHYLGHAFDMRSRNMTAEEAERFCLELRIALTTEFFVLLEDDHIHVQFNGNEL